MVELFSNLALGFSVAFSPENLLFCFIGAMLGTLIGVLPGLGPLATIAMLLPITFTLEPTGALVMLAGIYYGAQYGGSTTAILVNLPGESSSVVTTLDGYQMARQGKAGAALAMAAAGSFVAGCTATLLVAFAGPLLTELAQRFGAAEYFSLMVLGLVAAVILAHGSPLKAVLMAMVGIMLGMIGTDVATGAKRFTFDLSYLADGIGFVPLVMGLFGIAEIMRNLEIGSARMVLDGKIKGLMPTASDIRQSAPAIARGTAIGSVLGILPGGGAILSSFASYMLEKRLAKDPQRFGKGAIEGVAGPESANNAGAQTSFIPMLTLGIPSNPVMALMIGALMIHGVQPGPNVMTKQPELFWGVVASMWIGNLMLLVINLPLIGIWVRLLRVRYEFLFPAILLFCAIGAYSINNSVFDVVMMIFFAVFGYFLLKTGCEPAPLLLGFILGPMMEENMRRALMLSRGDALVFFERPISAGLLVASALLLASVLLPIIRRRRTEIFVE